MSIEFNLVEKKTFDYPIKKLSDFLNVDFEELAKESSVIDEFSKIDENKYDIKTKNKSVMKKELFLKTRLSYKKNIEKGMIHILSEKNDGDNLYIDCKVRAIPTVGNKTTIAVKLDATVDFGFSKLVNKGIKVMADKEIQKFLNETINSFDLNKIK